MIVNFFVVVPATLQHARAQAIVWPVVGGIAPAAVIAVIGGVAVSESQAFLGHGEAYLTGLFGLFLVYTGAIEVVHWLRPPPQSTETQPATATWQSGVLIGLPTGFLGGLLGIGGGLICVPLQRRILGLPLRNCIANSAATIIALSLVGATFKNIAVIRSGEFPWWYSFWLAGILIPTAFIAASYGGRFTHRLPAKYLRLVFVVLVFGLAYRMCSLAYAKL
jgi:uncharacterized membrane protein YfcA